jgi:hypothetical protein
MNFEVVYNKSLKIFSQLFVGVKPIPVNGGTPLAFATPYEDNAAGRKRQDTVKGWVGDTEYVYDPVTRKGSNRKYTPDIRMLENVPRAGFKVTDEVKRVYYGGGNVVWRIEDPSGWEVEIQSNNLMALLQSVGVSAGGEINGQCIWARDGAHNVLLPVTSQEYKDAVKAFESVKAPSKIPAKDRVIGRYYRLQDGTFGQYFGKFFITELLVDSAGDTNLGANLPGIGRCGISAEVHVEHVLNGQQAQYEVMYVPPYEAQTGHYKYQAGGELKLYKSAALIAELDQGTLEEHNVLQIVAENKLSFAGHKNTKPILATRNKPDDVGLTFEPISAEKFKETFDRVVKSQEEVLERHEHEVKQGYWVNRTPPVPPAQPKLSACGVFHWKRVCLLDEDRLYAFSTTLHRMHSSAEICDIIGRVQPRNGNRYDFVKPKDYHARVWQVGSDIWNKPEHIRDDAKVLPKFDTIAELKTYLNMLHIKGQLVQQRCKETT